MAKSAKQTKPATMSGAIREAMEASDLSRYRLAQLTGIPEITLGRFLRDERDLRLKTADKLAEALGLELVVRRKSKG